VPPAEGPAHRTTAGHRRDHRRDQARQPAVPNRPL